MSTDVASTDTAPAFRVYHVDPTDWSSDDPLQGYTAEVKVPTKADNGAIEISVALRNVDGSNTLRDDLDDTEEDDLRVRHAQLVDRSVAPIKRMVEDDGLFAGMECEKHPLTVAGHGEIAYTGKLDITQKAGELMDADTTEDILEQIHDELGARAFKVTDVADTKDVTADTAVAGVLKLDPFGKSRK